MKAIVVVALLAMLAAAALNHEIDRTAPVTLAAPEVLDLGPSFVDKITGYDTLELAGVAGIERAYKCSHYYECGGVIARRDSDGKFVVGPVTSSYHGDQVEIPQAAPDGLVIVATYHTHPCLEESHFVRFFSDADVMGAIVKHQTAIMGELCSGDVHEFDPMTMRPDTDAVPDGPDSTLYLTPGKLIGKIKVEGVSVEPKEGMI